MKIDVDLPATARPGSPFARGLNVMLWIAMGVMLLILAGMIIFGASMFFPNGLQSMVVSELSKFDNMPSPQKFGGMLFAASLIAAAYIFVIHLLRKIVGTLIEGDPFVPENISRLRTVWIVLAVFELFRMISRSLIAVEIGAMNVMESSGAAVDMEASGATLDIRLGTWFLVFVIAALAEVFRHGAVLRRDQEFTI